MPEPARRLASASWSTWAVNVEVDAASRVWVGFDADVGTRANELFLATIEGRSTRVVRVTEDDGAPSKYPVLAFAGRRAALTWSDERDGNPETYLATGRIGELRSMSMTRHARRVTTNVGSSIGAALAWNGERLGLTWSDNSVGQHEEYLQICDNRGRPLWPTMQLTHSREDSLIPSIQPWRDGFVLVWNEFLAGPGGGHGDDGRSELFTVRIECTSCKTVTH